MAELALLAAGISAGAQAIKAYQGAKLKDEEAEGIRAAGKRRMAAGTREVAEAKREKEFMHSRAVAVAAASGAGVDDPGMVKVLGDLQAEGLYRMSARLWNAQNDTEGLLFRADAANREAKAMRVAGVVNALAAGTSAYFGAKGGKATSLPSTSSGGTGKITERPEGFSKGKWGY